MSRSIDIQISTRQETKHFCGMSTYRRAERDKNRRARERLYVPDPKTIKVGKVLVIVCLLALRRLQKGWKEWVFVLQFLIFRVDVRFIRKSRNRKKTKVLFFSRTRSSSNRMHTYVKERTSYSCCFTLFLNDDDFDVYVEAGWLELGPRRRPKAATLLTNRCLYWRRRLARPVFFLRFSCLAT